MKHLSKLALAFIMAFVLFSCTKEEEIVDVASLGSITSDRGMTIGTGQTATFSVPITVNTPISELDYAGWCFEDPTSLFAGSYVLGIMDDDTYTFSYDWSTPGEYKLECVYNYFLGTESFSLSTYTYVTVIQSHFQNSMIGDALDVVLSDNATLYLLDNSEDVYYKIVSDKSYFFEFSNGVLASGYSFESKTSTIDGAAYSCLVYEYITGESSDMIDYSTIEYHVKYSDGYEPTEDVLEAVSEFEAGTNLTGTEYKNIIGEAVKNNEISSIYVVADILGDSTVSCTVTVYADSDSEDTYNITAVTTSK